MTRFGRLFDNAAITIGEPPLYDKLVLVYLCNGRTEAGHVVARLLDIILRLQKMLLLAVNEPLPKLPRPLPARNLLVRVPSFDLLNIFWFGRAMRA